MARAVLSIFYKGFFDLKSTGLENIPQDGRGIIFAPNHTSYLDPPVIGISLKKRITYLAKDYLFQKPALGALLRWMGFLPIKTQASDFRSMRDMLRLLEAGRRVVIFPEGTRSADGRMKEPESGVGFMAVKSRAAVVPVYIEGTFEALPKGAKFFRCAPVRAHFGRAFVPAADEALMKETELYLAVSRRIMDEIKKIKEKVEKEKKGS